MMVHQYRCDSCGDCLDYLAKDSEFEWCPFCGADTFQYEGVAGCVGSISDTNEGE